MELTLPADTLDLPPAVPHYLHHFEPGPEGCDRLVVSFAGLQPDPTKPRTTWPYRARLRTLAAHRLFVDPAPAERDGRWFHWPLAVQFVDAARREIGVRPENCVMNGSSLGGTIGLIAGVRAGFGHAVAGSPIAHLGDYLLGELPENVEGLLDGRVPDQRQVDVLNGLVVAALAERDTPLLMHLYYGEADHLYPRDFDLIVDTCAANPHIELHTFTEPGYTHYDVFRPWARYVTDLLKRTVGTV